MELVIKCHQENDKQTDTDNWQHTAFLMTNQSVYMGVTLFSKSKAVLPLVTQVPKGRGCIAPTHS
jgi:hypothetical protein